MIFARALGEALRTALATDPRVIVLGEDIIDPYGGSFKVTRGLSSEFPNRVLPTPISEAAIAGISGGLALAGYRPIAEIMFGDFTALCFDQIANHICKYEAMYNGQATCPVILRTPFGGGRGYGPTHSQSLEKHFLGIPHLRVVAASLFSDPASTYAYLLQTTAPVLFVEHKLLYPATVERPEDGMLGAFIATPIETSLGLPVLSLSLVPREECSVTVAAYGYQATVARGVIETLGMDDEIFAELLIYEQIAPMDWAPLEQSVAATGALVTVEEGTAGWSWGTQAAAEVTSRCFRKLRHPVKVVASQPDIVPSAKDLEAEMLVGTGAIEAAIRELAA
jgi:acetoin:2,6-dichlorophenolindophenol oxidoreductase subunit beta